MLNSGVSASGETDEKLLTIGVSATGKVVANGVAAEEGGKSKTSARRSCFGSENDGGMGCFCDWEEIKSVEQRCFGVRETVTSVLQRCFSIGEMNSAAQRCFSIMKNHQCCTTVFQHHEKSSVLHNGVSAS